MANNPQKSVEIANDEADLTGHKHDGGYLRYYEGTIPATANASLGSAVLLAEMRFGGTAFSPAVSGTIQANAIAPETSAKATGTPQFYRTFKADGISPLLQGTVGLTGCDINIDDTNVILGMQVTCDSFYYSVPRGA